jgi:zinc D-Ala-D-Ala carboxypeptidase
MTEHFTRAELTCKCGCGMLPELGFMVKVEKLRTMYSRPLVVSSAARCPKYNMAVSKTGQDGPHTTGRAIDFSIYGAEALHLVKIVTSTALFTGLGINQKGPDRFVHVDDLPGGPGCPRPWIWSY